MYRRLSPTSVRGGRVRGKTAFIFAFAKFVVWPDDESPESISDADPFVISVLGEEPLFEALQVITGKRIHNRTVATRGLLDLSQYQSSQVLLCALDDLRDLLITAPEAAGNGVLTVGDEPGFAEAGGILQLTFVDEHLAFVVNRAAARRVGLELSSSISSLAERVIDDDGLDLRP